METGNGEAMMGQEISCFMISSLIFLHFSFVQLLPTKVAATDKQFISWRREFWHCYASFYSAATVTGVAQTKLTNHKAERKQ